MLKRLGLFARSIEDSWFGDILCGLMFCIGCIETYFILFAVMP